MVQLVRDEKPDVLGTQAILIAVVIVIVVAVEVCSYS